MLGLLDVLTQRLPPTYVSRGLTVYLQSLPQTDGARAHENAIRLIGYLYYQPCMQSHVCYDRFVELADRAVPLDSMLRGILNIVYVDVVLICLKMHDGDARAHDLTAHFFDATELATMNESERVSCGYFVQLSQYMYDVTTHADACANMRDIAFVIATVVDGDVSACTDAQHMRRQRIHDIVTSSLTLSEWDYVLQALSCDDGKTRDK